MQSVWLSTQFGQSNRRVHYVDGEPRWDQYMQSSQSSRLPDKQIQHPYSFAWLVQMMLLRTVKIYAYERAVWSYEIVFFCKCVSSFRCRHNIPLLSSKRYIHNPFEFLCFIFSVLSQSVNAEIIQTYYTRQHIPISCKRECTTNGTSSRCEWHLHFVVKPRLSSTMILWDIQGPVPI